MPVPVNENTGDKGFIVLTDVKIKVGESIITPNYASIDGIAITNLNGAYMKIECAPGNHSVTFAYKDGSIGYAEETITVEVKSGLETKVIGYIDGTGSSGSGESQTTVMQPIQGGVKATEEVKVESSIVPLTTSTSGTKTTVTFEAGSFTKDSTDAVLNLSVKSVGSEFSVTSTGSSTPVAGINISLFVNGNEVKEFNGKEVVIETYIAKNLNNVKVYYDGSEITGSTYDPLTGKLVFKTNHFSEFYVGADEIEAYNTSSNTAYATLEKAIDYAQTGDIVKLMADYTIPASNNIEIAEGKNFTLDLNGKTITEEGAGARKIINSGELTIIDSFGTGKIQNKYVGESGKDGSYGLIDNYGTLTIESGNFTDVAHGNGSSFRNRPGATLIINGGTFVNTADDSGKQASGFTGAANAFVYSDGTDVRINGGTFTMECARYTPAIKIMAGTGSIEGATISTYMSGGVEVGCEVEIRNTNISVSEVNSYFSNAIAVSNDGKVDVYSGTFTGYEYGAYIYSSGGIINIYGGTINAQTALRADNDDYVPKNSKINVYGGSFRGGYTVGTEAKLAITGGTFSVDPSAYVINGYGCRLTSNEYYEVVTARDAGYKIGPALPVGPIVSGNVWTVNPSNAQYTLDGAYGSIDGKTIHFSSGEYTDTLILGRPTKYAGSNTEYRHGRHSNDAMSYEAFIAYKNQSGWTESCYYSRSISDVKFTSDKDVVLNGFVTDAGAHVYGPGSYDYVRDTGIILNEGSCYYTKCNLTNFTFEGLNFEGKTNIHTSETATVIDGVTFKNCKFDINNTASGNQALRYYNENNNGNVKNLTVDNCTFNNCFQGVYTQNINGITVKNSTFDTTGHNAIAVQSGSGAVNHKEVVITGNTFNKIGDRIIRFGNVGADTQITIQNNTATNSGDTSGEVIKAQSLAVGITYNISGNNWGEGKTVANTELIDQ